MKVANRAVQRTMLVCIGSGTLVSIDDAPPLALVRSRPNIDLLLMAWHLGGVPSRLMFRLRASMPLFRYRYVAALP